MDESTARFRDYLEAKVAVDDASLHTETQSRFHSFLAARRSPNVLDLGTGTGAMIRRIIATANLCEVSFVGLDADPWLLRTAATRTRDLLGAMGYVTKQNGFSVSATATDKRVACQFVTGDLFDPALSATPGIDQFDAITAHAFLDLVPPGDAFDVITGLLAPGGVLYATINYNGVTELLPWYADREFEERLWKIYNRSMDDRRVRGKHTAGSRSGSVVYNLAVERGFEILGLGSSDWCVAPLSGSYAPGHELFLDAILRTVYEEELSHPEVDKGALAAWYAERSSRLSACELSLTVHQIDLLARVPAD